MVGKRLQLSGGETQNFQKDDRKNFQLDKNLFRKRIRFQPIRAIEELTGKFSKKFW